MAWYNAIIGGGTGQANPYLSTAAVSSTSAAGSILQTNSAQSYWGAQQAQSAMAHQNTMYVVMQYADAIGWSVTHHHLPVGVTSDDPKIAILKITSVGEVLKDVGVRTSDTDYYVMREPSE